MHVHEELHQNQSIILAAKRQASKPFLLACYLCAHEGLFWPLRGDEKIGCAFALPLVGCSQLHMDRPAFLLRRAWRCGLTAEL